MEAMLPLEILSESLKVTTFDTNSNEEERRQELDMIDKKCQATQLRQAAYKPRTENFYNKRVRVKTSKSENGC